jgi:hypothetical protein
MAFQNGLGLMAELGQHVLDTAANARYQFRPRKASAQASLKFSRSFPTFSLI